MQNISFNLPVFLATPVSVAIVIAHCLKGIDFLNNFWCICPEGTKPFIDSDRYENGTDKTWDLDNDSLYQLGALSLSWVSLIIIGGHIWWSTQNVLDPSEK